MPGDTAGGRYVSGVTSVVLTKPSVAADEATAPLRASIDGLTSALTARAGELADANDAMSRARADRIAASRLRKLELSMPVELPSLAAFANRGLVLRPDGPAGRPTSVRLMIARVEAKKLGLRSRIVVAERVTIGADGSVTFVLKPPAAARALKANVGKLALLAEATTGDRRSLVSATVRR